MKLILYAEYYMSGFSELSISEEAEKKLDRQKLQNFALGKIKTMLFNVLDSTGNGSLLEQINKPNFTVDKKFLLSQGILNSTDGSFAVNLSRENAESELQAAQHLFEKEFSKTQLPVGSTQELTIYSSGEQTPAELTTEITLQAKLKMAEDLHSTQVEFANFKLVLDPESIQHVAQATINLWKKQQGENQAGAVDEDAQDVEEDKETEGEKEEIRSTPEEDLLLDKETTEQVIFDIREIIAEDEYFQLIRKQLKTQIPELEIKEVNGIPHVVVYRNIDVSYEEATTAAGLCRNRGPKSEFQSQVTLKEQLQRMNAYNEETKEPLEMRPNSREHPGRIFFDKTVGNHMAESDDSLYIPTSTFKYAQQFGSLRESKIIQITVPLKFVVPVYEYANNYMPNFKDEKEVAIAGRIEPEWIKTIDVGEYDDLAQQELQRVATIKPS